jgi:hypothetical protein
MAGCELHPAFLLQGAHQPDVAIWDLVQVRRPEPSVQKIPPACGGLGGC